MAAPEYGILAQVVLDDTIETDIFSPGAGRWAEARLHLANPDTVDTTVTIWFLLSGTGTDAKIGGKVIPVPFNDPVIIPITLSGTQKISGKSANDLVVATVMGAEEDIPA